MLTKLLDQLLPHCQHLNPVEIPSKTTGSIYIKLHSKQVRLIRIANHTGHKTRSKTWELRTDAMTTRQGTIRIYHKTSLNSIIRDLKNTKPLLI